MSERSINEQQIRQSALGVVARLEHVAANHKRTFPSQIEAVLVFSGPGTYIDRLKPSQMKNPDDPNSKDQDHLRWMDRDRIRAGVAVVRDVCATRLIKELGLRATIADVTNEYVLSNGPILVYNGIPKENEVFRGVLKRPTTKIPANKVLIIDELRRSDRTIPIAHTGHQVESFYQEVANPYSPLHGVMNVAVVAHISDFARNLFYLKKYNDLYVAAGNEGITFWVYAIKNRPGSKEILIDEEIGKVITYAQRRDLATEPARFNT